MTLKLLQNCVFGQYPRLPNDPMLNIWFNMKNNCSRKRIKNWGGGGGGGGGGAMHSYICGISLRSESSLVLSDILFG